MGAASQDKTAFVTLRGLFQFQVMPFRLHGALATFQRLMDWVINGLDAFAAAFLDDLVIHSSTWVEHLTQLTVVFDCLHSAGLTAKPSKCQFGMSRCTYLGHVIGGSHVCLDPSKIQSVDSFLTPTNKKQVRRLLVLNRILRIL